MIKSNYRVCMYKDANLFLALPLNHCIDWMHEPLKAGEYQISLAASDPDIWAVYYETETYPVHVLLPNALFNKDFEILDELDEGEEK